MNKIQELEPSFMVRLRDEIYPLWKTFMHGNWDQRNPVAERMVSNLAFRLENWADDYHLGNQLASETTWQFERWEESGELRLCFEREYEISDTQIHGCYPFSLVASLEFDEEPLPESAELVRPENYSRSQDYVAAVSGALGEQGVWRLAPDHAELDKRCEMLVRYHVLNQPEAEIVAQLKLAPTVFDVRKAIRELGGLIGVELRPFPTLRLAPEE